MLQVHDLMYILYFFFLKAQNPNKYLLVTIFELSELFSTYFSVAEMTE